MYREDPYEGMSDEEFAQEIPAATTDFWVLGSDGKTPRPATLAEWGVMFASRERFLWTTEVNGLRIVTAFLGYDHEAILGERRPPLLFGTLVGTEETLYATWDEAKAGHEAAVARARAGE
jgi:hypothetical protein